MDRFILFALVLSCSLVADAQQQGDLRLVGSTSSSEGRVEIYWHSDWGTLRYDTSGYQQKGAAQAICRQLGFNDQLDYGVVSKFNFPEAGSSTIIWFSNIYCSYNYFVQNAEQHVLRCDYNIDVGTTDHFYDFAVRCDTSNPYLDPYDTQVRLVQGNTGYTSSGFVEVYLWGSWGPVCDMGGSDADSACRQLGYTESVSVKDEPDYGKNVSDNVNSFHCSYAHPCLRSCFTYPTANADIRCNGRHSVLTCDFSFLNEYGDYGSSSTCSNFGTAVAIIVGAVFAALVAMFLMVCIPVVVCCCCIPGCILHSTRRRNSYYTITS